MMRGEEVAMTAKAMSRREAVEVDTKRARRHNNNKVRVMMAWVLRPCLVRETANQN